jgi:hypothetical protein
VLARGARMTGYYFWGLVSSTLFLSAIPAIVHQLRLIWKRRREISKGLLHEPATLSISLNQIFSSYCAVYSFFLFGLVSDSPDPFLTYPRAVVGALLWAVIFEIARDRRSSGARWALAVCSLSWVAPLVLLMTGHRTSNVAQSGSSVLICAAAAFLAQGNISQYVVLKRTQKRGGVSLPMHLVLYGKDFAGLMFGLQIGVSAWSIILMHGVNLLMRAPIIYTYTRIKTPPRIRKYEDDEIRSRSS